MNRKKIYTDIFKLNYWNSQESVSGAGSELGNMQNVIKELPVLFNKFGIKTVLDIPCGDFNWMKCVVNPRITYLGADIVDEIVEDNIIHHSIKDKVEFKVLDIIVDDLPKVDLVIVKDCFIHFSLEDIKLALLNIKKSGSKYILITNGTDRVTKNDDIITGGGYRGLNFSLEPFNLIQPIYEIDTLVCDSKLSLWELDKIDIK